MNRSTQGTTLVEILISITVFSIFGLTLISSLSGLGFAQIRVKHKQEATQLSREGLEIAYNLAHHDWENFKLNIGTFHPTLVNERLTLEPNAEMVAPYTRKVIIDPVFRDSDGNLNPTGTIDPDLLFVTSTISWSEADTPYEVALTTYLINLTQTP